MTVVRPMIVSDEARQWVLVVKMSVKMEPTPTICPNRKPRMDMRAKFIIKNYPPTQYFSAIYTYKRTETPEPKDKSTLPKDLLLGFLF